MSDMPISCPLCGKPPLAGLGKKQGCQLHGEPMQSVTLSCRPTCIGRIFVETGDIYNGGKGAAKAEAVKIWNEKISRTHCQAALQRADEVIEAAQNIIQRWDTPNWKETEPTALFIYRLRDAIAAYKAGDGGV